MKEFTKIADDVALFIVGAIAIFCFIIFAFILAIFNLIEAVIVFLWRLFCDDIIIIEPNGRQHHHYTFNFPWWILALVAFAIWINYIK